MDKVSFSGRFKIGTRIFSGYGIVLIFLGLLVVLGYLALSKIGNSVIEFDRVSDNSVRVLTIDRNIVGLRRNVLLFTGGSSNQDALGRIHEIEVTLKRDIGAVISATRSSERRAMLENISTLFGQYAANVEKVVDLRTRWTKEIEGKMNPLGQSMRSKLSDIMAASFAGQNLDIAARAGLAQESLMMARLSAVKFINKPDQSLSEEVRKRYGEFNTRIDELSHFVSDSQRAAILKQVIEEAKIYLTAFDDVAFTGFEIERIINKDNKAIADDIANLSKKLTEAQLSRLNDLGEEVCAEHV